jgi:hypothetical protein
MHKHKVGVAFIMETWLQTQWELPFYGHCTEKMDRGDGYEGRAVYLKHEIPHQIIYKSIQHNSIQVLGVETGSITYYLIYIPPCMQLSVRFSHNQVNLLNKPVALPGGDFNIQDHMQ